MVWLDFYKSFSDFIKQIQKIYYLSGHIKHVYLLLEFLISSFISSYSFSRLFTETNSSLLIFESIKASEDKTFIIIAEVAIPTGIPTKEHKKKLKHTQ